MGVKWVGVAWQRGGALGKTINCQLAVFLDHVEPLERRWWTSSCISPRSGLGMGIGARRLGGASGATGVLKSDGVDSGGAGASRGPRAPQDPVGVR